MKIDKTYVTKLINEEYEKIVINELFSKREANLSDIMDGDQTPTIDEIIKSDHFQKNLFKDLISNKSKFTDWKIDKANGASDNDITKDETIPTYTFKFNYNYKDNKIPRLGLVITGDPTKENSTVDLSLQHEGKDVPLRRLDGKDWMTPSIKNEVAKSVLSPYL
jgi:hypothetical protein